MYKTFIPHPSPQGVWYLKFTDGECYVCPGMIHAST